MYLTISLNRHLPESIGLSRRRQLPRSESRREMLNRVSGAPIRASGGVLTKFRIDPLSLSLLRHYSFQIRIRSTLFSLLSATFIEERERKREPPQLLFIAMAGGKLIKHVDVNLCSPLFLPAFFLRDTSYTLYTRTYVTHIHIYLCVCRGEN